MLQAEAGAFSFPDGTRLTVLSFCDLVLSVGLVAEHCKFVFEAACIFYTRVGWHCSPTRPDGELLQFGTVATARIP